MNRQSQIDATLRVIGGAQPPAGLERRIHARLETSRRGPSAVHSVSVIAIAASITVAALALSPGLREMALHGRPAYPLYRRAMPHPAHAFGGASAAHVPAALVPVEPTPVNQGRGHSRSAEQALPSAGGRPLPRGVALPPRPQTRISALPAPSTQAASER